MMNYFETLKIVQTAYVVQDLDQAIERWHAAFGLGPFVVNRHIPIKKALYRGTPTPLDISAAFVQSGDIQIEFLCQHSSEPSAFRDIYGEGQEGLHHVAVFPDDHDQLVNSLQARGFAIATELCFGQGLGASFIDIRDLSGHMLEVYRDNGSISAFYKLVAAAARNWDGRSLIVDASELTSPG